MKITKMFLVLAISTWMVGCAAYTPFGDVVIPGGVVVDRDHDGGGHDGGGRGFCPPGQAKKGNC
ncbi:hypothetical protein [Aquirhabdus sp.]|uniref:hypothetical protein n=1 Tax=Aquirhabdus sp. TaxID=2824160 RepID=UPI00396C60F0